MFCSDNLAICIKQYCSCAGAHKYAAKPQFQLIIGITEILAKVRKLREKWKCKQEEDFSGNGGNTRALQRSCLHNAVYHPWGNGVHQTRLDVV